MNNKKNDICIRRSQLSPAKQALLEKRLRGELKADNQQKFIPRRSQDNPVPLSFAQQRLWFLAQLEPDNPFYNVSAVASLKGKLNFKALQDSFQEIINRHEALRCNFKTIEDKPVAFIYPTKSLLLPVLDISELSINQQAAEVQKLASQEAQHPFDLSRDLLLRVKLLRLNPEEHILLFIMHHIVSDGWSIGVLIYELATLYQDFCDDKVLSLPELPIQYGDFAIWQQEYLQGEALTAQKNYWKRQLGGALPVLQLPTDYPRPAVQSYKGNNYCFTIPKYLTTALKMLSQQAGATLFMTLLTAFKILLYRYSQENDIIIGTAIANRNLPQIEKLIGFFVNTLVLRTDVSDNPSFLDLLARVKETTLDAYTHQDLPFEQLVEEIQPERNLSHNPIFQVWFALNNSPMPALEIGELTLTISEAESATSQFDLSLDMVERQEELIGTFEYSSDLFDANTITHIAEHFQTLLAGIIANPKQPIASLPLLTKAAENDLLRKWNNNQVEYPQNQCIHQLFDNCVNKTPNAVAVISQQQRLTYQELNHKANQLAHYLRSLGVNQNVLVGICVERSVEMIVALLGVLKAGGAYVPLDPAYPEERLSFMLSNSQVSVLLTQQSLVSSLPIENVPVVCLDRDWEIISQQSQLNPDTYSSPDDLAYVIYTSGSTGKSKGVAIAHHSLVNKFYAWAKAYQLDSLTSHLQMASFAFDVFSGDLIRALCSGAKLVLCPREWLLEAENLYQLMLAEKVDSAEFVPVVLKNLVQYLERTGQNLHFMRLLVVGSDTLYVKEYQEFQRFCGEQTRLINSYGVTEATIDSTYFEFTEVNLSENGLVPIGRPFANTEIYILDPYLQPVPVGIPGELYIGGVGLAEGYLHRPDLTKEKFIIWNGEKRLYKTGDKAKYLADGNIEFLGRLDYQIKLRGFRIELGEIEAVIKQYPDVSEAVVISKEDVPGDQRLVAYFVHNSQVAQINQHSQLALDLREFLEQKLPEYMIPAAFVALEALPITPNGKLDRRALPAPEATQLLSQSDFIAPSTAIEEMLVNIWTEILGIENIGIHHNFFNLGGHSLLATRLVAQIRQVFQIELPLRRIFEKPTIAGLAKDIEKASKANLGVELTKIEPIERSPHLPLSFTQQGFWFLAQFEMHSSSYNMPSAVRLQGQLNVKAFQQSFNEILRRHEALRTNFHTIEGQPVAVILPPAAVQLPILNISNLLANQQELQVQQQAREEAQQAFDLNEGFLLRVKLLRLSEQEHILLLTMHHIASDAWSTDILMREFATLYQAFCEGQPAPLAELPIQYVDFAAWQRQWLQGERLESQISYWRKQLEGAPKLLELPIDFPRPAIQSFRGATYTFELPQQLSVALNQLSQQQGSTLFMTLLAAFKTLLYRYTGSEDIAVGSPIGSRNRAELEGLIGLFINTLVLRTNLAENTTFSELLKRVREVALGAYAHQDLPFELLVEELQPQRYLSHTPLFQVMFVLQNAPMSALELPNLTLSLLESDSGTAKFDLSLDMTETESGLIGSLEYNTDLFQESTIKRMAGHLETLLEAIVANPQQRLSQLPLLTVSEQHQLLREWNDTKVSYPIDKCIHELFTTQVERTPNAVAVVFQQQRLTYQELNSKANQLAHYLHSLGVNQNVLVGICVERSVEMIVALLGVLKAGGAYVPLDPAYPEERLSFMLSNSQVSVLLTQQSLVSSLPIENVPVVCLDRDWEIISQQSQLNPDTYSSPDDLAYVIYTSGSTGKSKGVAIAHHSLVNKFYAWAKAYQLDSLTSHLQMASFAFDVFSGDLIRALCSGAKLVLCPREWLLEAENLYQLMLAEKVDSAEFVPVVLKNLVQYLERTGQNLHFMRLLVVGSDTLYVKEYQEFQRFCGEQTRLINSYGVTEATIDSTYFEFTEVNLSENGLVPIGRPFANTEIYILDPYLQPVPVGIPGELYIGGVGLAEGYLHRPDLTKEKFIIWNGEKRLYKTGDKAKYLADGNIEFLGRLDYQIKLRGFRIELGEIEAVIKQYPDVSEAVVISKEDVPGDQRLVAYFVHNSQVAQINQHSQLALDLREFLEQKLPEYMIPAAFVALEALPITPNGKLDRRALPAPEATQLLSQSDFIAPSTAIEEMLVNIWTEILGIENIGIHHNFFNLGGHSLLATRLVAQIRQVFQIELPLRRIFEKPTIAGLAKDIEKASKANLGVELTKIEPIERSPHLPLSFAQQRLWFLAELEPNSASYNIPIAVHLQGQLNVEVLQQSFNEIINRHEALQTNFHTIEGQAIAVISEAAPFILTIFDISNLPANQLEAEVKQQALQEAQTPFDLKKDLLLRVKLLRLGEEEHVVLLTMQHIVSDGWSTGILVQELATLYEAFCNGELLSPLPPLPIQYVDFAAWQRQWLQGEVLETQMAYWRKQLADAPKVLELPTDYPRPAIQTFRGATYSFNLSHQLSLALNKLSQQQGSTLFMTLLAAFQSLLYRYTGSEDIAIGSPIANRNRAEIEGLIGVFINTLVLRTNLAGNPTFAELLKRVREVALGAYAHQDLPFELLVEELQPQRDLSHTPLFQVMFVLQNAPMSALELPNLTLTILESDSGTAQFDLSLDMTETESGLIGSLEYNTDLFQESTIRRMAGHLETLLEGIVVNSQQRLSQLPLLTASEHQLLREWNNTEVVYPVDKCIHELFEQQVERTPDAVAVVYVDGQSPASRSRSVSDRRRVNQQLTYRELNTKANQLAHYLRSQGVNKNLLVGICVDRSIEMIVALLGVLKAGRAYVPLDPAYPQERIADILADTELGFLLTQEQFLDKLLVYTGKTISLDTDWPLIATHNTANPISDVHLNNLAYIIYTSGSTGKPKGVMIEHRSVMNFVITTIDKYGINASDKVLQFASICFDTSIEEIFPCLSVGATLVLRTEEMLNSSEDFWQCCQKWQLTVVDLPTAYWHQLVAELNTGDSRIPEGLRTVIIGGEEVQLEKVQHWYSCVAHLSQPPQLFNSYGPTEATVVTTLECLTPAATSVSIGRPISNAQVYVLDKYLQPLPIGVPGELHIGGAGLARGYWQRPELTAEKFIEVSSPTLKLYKTGDLVRFRTDGNLEYLGRVDNQVKIRGFRIELSEIETVLRQHPQVSQAVAIAHEDIPGQKRLVAYFLPQVSPPTIDELRDFLKQKLPNYMIPAAFMVLESIPMTPNRKVDYRALPTPEFSQSSEDKFIAPRTLIEEKLVAIWSEVLRVEKVGIHDNFFALGGDSILSLQVISKANQAGLHLTPKQLFQHQTIAELATVTSTNTPILAEQGLVTGSFPLTPIQRWFFEENANSNHYNQAVLLEVQQTLDPIFLEQVTNSLLQHHDLLRSQFIQESLGWQARITEFESVAPITVIDLSALPPESQSTAITTTCSELQASLNLFSGKLLQVALFNLGVNQHSRLFIVIHHLVVDGVSWRILLEDLQTAYAQLSRGETIKLSPKTTSFKQWAYQLQEYAQSPAVQEEMDYWVQTLRQSFSFLPVDYPAGDNTVSSAASVTVTLNAEETRALLQDVPSAYRTQINDALLLALVQVFAKWTGQTRLLLDLEGHGREEIFSDIDISRTIGWFTTVFPIVLSVEENSNIGETLKMVKEQLRQIPNRGIGYGLLRYLSSDRSIIAQLQQLPQAQVIFNYLGQIDQVLSDSSLFQPATESSGSESSLQENRQYLLEIDAIVVASQLQVNWKYSQNIHQTSTIENLALNFVQVLRSLIAHCQSLKSKSYTPSDFPLAKLDWQTLNRLVNSKQQIEDIYPLSSVQYGMLFHLLYDPKSSAYLCQTSCTLQGNLNVWAFEQAWNKVIERHSILRTAFVWEGLDTPLQIVLPQVQLYLQQQDWQNLSASEQQTRLAEFLPADLDRGFNLDEAPLIRLTLIQLSPDTYHLIWNCHHILFDGWSLPLLLKEVFGFYKALSNNQPMQLPASRPYRDYIAWLQQQNLRSAEAYWRQTLAGVYTPTPLPLQQTSHKLSSEESHSYEQDIPLSQATTNALASLTRQYKLTLNTLMQGVWALLLSHYSGETDILFGATVSGRPPSLTAAESMIGLFINTIPVRVKLSKKDLFLPWLTQIQHSQVEAREYEFSPLVKIQEWSQIPKGLPLFNNIVVFENYPVDDALESENMGLEIKNVRSWSRNHYPLTLRVLPGAELSIQILWMSETSSQRVNAGAIARITQHLQILLSDISSSPHFEIQQLLEKLTAVDKQQQLIQKSELQATERQKLKMTKRKAIRDI